MRKLDLIDLLRMNQLCGLEPGVSREAWQRVLGPLPVYPGTTPGVSHASSGSLLLTLDDDGTLQELRLTPPRAGATVIQVGGHEYELAALTYERDVEEVSTLLQARELPFRRTEAGRKWDDLQIVFHFDRGARLAFWYSDCISGLTELIFASRREGA